MSERDRGERAADPLVEQLEALDVDALQAASERAAAAAARQDDDALAAWLARPEPGWSARIAPQALAAATFLSGGSEEDRLRVRWFRRDSDGAMMGKAWFGPLTQGPPGHAHGGSMASLLDEAMGGAAWIAGHPVLAGELRTRFRRMLPLGSRCIVEARVDSFEGRKVMTRGTLADVDGTTYATGSGLFIELDPERSGEILEKIARYFGADRDGLASGDATT